MSITSNAAAATAAYEHFIKFRMQYSSLAILYYDYVLTFADEIHYMWRLRSLTQISTLLYICCRYAIPGNLMYLLANAGVLGGIDRCNTWYRIIAALSVMGRASVIKGNLLSIMIPIYDFIAATFTITRGIQALKKMPRTATLQDSVYYLLVEQAISAITITQSISSFHPVNPAGGAAFIGQINAFSVPVSGLLIARFLLRLRAAQENLNPSSGTLRTAGICSTVQFADRDALSSSTTGTSTFRAVAGENGEGMPTESTFRRVIDSVMNEFGDDPVARTKDMLDITAVEASDVSLVVGDQV
ncbi:hypothetical protein F5879DRAFT_1012212 [Lentinula edodes]|nr:hypothetical protein F5879DRAFT_1012212 [Lentinula edodes]